MLEFKLGCYSYPWKVILVHTFRPFWGESLEPSSLDLVPHPATRLNPEMFPCQGNLQGVFTKEYASTLTTVLYVRRTHLFGQRIIGTYQSNRVK